MDDEIPWFETVSLPALLRHARAIYGTAMRQALTEAGYDDIPANGLYVIGAMAFGDETVPLGKIIEDMRISKQAAGQLIDTLVTRGYLTREVDENDRRKLTIELTPRGKAAAETQGVGRKKIDAELLDCVGEEAVRTTRRTLAALANFAKSEAD